MELHARQSLLARLYTSSEARREFAAAAGLDAGQLEQTAASLVWKRAREAARLLPFTSAALGDRFGVLFRAHASQVAPGGSRKPLADAMAFAAGLRRAPDAVVREAARFDWYSHTLRFRMARQGSSPIRCEARRRRSAFVTIRRFAFGFPAVVGTPPASSAWRKRRTVVLFLNVAGRCGVWYW